MEGTDDLLEMVVNIASMKKEHGAIFCTRKVRNKRSTNTTSERLVA